MTQEAMAAPTSNSEAATNSEAVMNSEAVNGTTRAYVETYGCQMNVSDGELMQGILSDRGFAIATAPEDADVILVNTCAIREHAEQRVLGRVAELNRLKLERPDLVIGVTGCMAQRMGEDLLERAPYVDLVMGPDAYRGLPDALGRLRPGIVAGEATVGSTNGVEDKRSEKASTVAAHHFAPYRAGSRARTLPVLRAPEAAEHPTAAADAAQPTDGRARADGRIAALGFEPHENYEGLEAHRASRVAAWVPVQRGCNYRCTYCIVPYVRGPEKNRDPENILDDVRAIAREGTAEITLLGQTVNSYRHGKWDFAGLLRAVAHVDGIRRVRFTSPHPNDFTPGLIEAMAEEPAVCNHLHLPVQSGDDRTLKRMLRRYTVEEYLQKIAEVRAAIPEIALSTDIIVAFPGETEAEFEATLDLVGEVRFDDAFMYKYSPRDGTPATRMPDDDFLDGAEAQSRLERLIGVQRGIQAEINRSKVGQTVEVLVEREARSEGDVLGRTERNKAVAFPGDASALVRQFVHVCLTATTGATFTGERVAGQPGDVAREPVAAAVEGTA